MQHPREKQKGGAFAGRVRRSLLAGRNFAAGICTDPFFGRNGLFSPVIIRSLDARLGLAILLSAP